MDKEPFTAPAALGAKVMVMVAVCPGARTIGSAVVVTPKPAPEVVTWEKVTLGPSLAEELVRVSELLLLLPNWTLPKSRLDLLRLRLPSLLLPVLGADRLAFGIAPPHETPSSAARNTTTRPWRFRLLVLKSFICLRYSLDSMPTLLDESHSGNYSIVFAVLLRQLFEVLTA
jgi:hypothetical protein